MVLAILAAAMFALAASPTLGGSACTLEVWSGSDPTPGTSTSTRAVSETVFLRAHYPGNGDVLEERFLNGALSFFRRHSPDASGNFEAQWSTSEEAGSFALLLTGTATGCVQEAEVMLVVAGEPPDTAIARPERPQIQFTALGLLLILVAVSVSLSPRRHSRP
jgi:hypothetical protein